jgi:hypothetical protein
MSRQNFKVIKFAGLTLGGGKGRKTCLSLLEYYVREKKLFLSQLHEGIEESVKISSDTQIVKLLEKQGDSLHTVGVDAPLILPKCLRCRLQCPGHEKCQEPEIRWMWKLHKIRDPKKRPNKVFTPYTERCVEQWICNEISPELVPDHAFGSNRAPLSARALYLKRRIKSRLVEVIPRLSVWQLGQEMGMRKNHLLLYKQMARGANIRQRFLDRWSEEGLSFIYHRDFKAMVKDTYAFDSFICAYTAYLNYKGLCEKRPKNFPKSEAWVSFPARDSES